MTWQPPPYFASEKEEPQTLRTPPSLGGGERIHKTKDRTPPTHVPDLPDELSWMHRLTTVPTVGAEQTPWILPPQRQLSPTTRTTSPPAGYAPTSSGRRSTKTDGGGWNQALFVPDPQTGTPKDGASHVQQQDGTVPLDHGSDCDSDEDVIRVPSREYLDGTNNKSIASNKRENLLRVDQTLLRTRIQWSQLLVSKAFKRYRQMICAMDDDLPNPDDIDDIDAMTAEDVLETNMELIKVRDEMLDDPHLNEKEIAAFFEGYNLVQMKVNSLQSQLNSLKTLQRHQSYCSNSGEMGSAPQRRVLSDLPGGLTSESSHKSAASLSRVSFGTQPIPPVRIPHDDDDLGSEQPIVSTLESRSTPPKGGFHTRSSPSLRMMSIQRIRKETSGQKGSEDVQKLLEELEIAERRQKKLERQLAQAGVVIADDIPYDVAKQKVASIAQRMDEIGFANTKDKKLQEEYFLLEREMEKYTGALQLTDDWIEEQEQLERQWEESVAQGNERAAKKLRRHMPVDVRNRSEASLATDVTPNGRVLPKEIAKKFKRTNVLQLLRIDPSDIAPMHAATLENLRIAGVTLTERRALYHHLKDIGSRWTAAAQQGDKMAERKWTWFSMMKSNFKENLKAWQSHVEQYGPPDNHPYLDRSHPEAGGCPLLGRQCPVKADKTVNYDGDYGFPEGPEYFRPDLKKQSDVGHLSKEKHETRDVLKEKNARERSTALKSHYKGNILSVAMANGSCESMDDMIDTMESEQENWIKTRLSEGHPSEEAKKNELGCFKYALKELKLSVLQLAERSGMQLTGKRDANADQLDSRSIIELALCEDVIKAALDFLDGIEERMLECRLKDGPVTVTIQQLRTLLDELHERNVSTMKTLGQVRPPRSSVLKTRHIIAMNLNLQNNLGREGKANPTPDGGALPGLPVRGGDLRDFRAALAGRGVGGQGRGGSPGRGRGPGSLLAAIGRHGKQGS